jgi:hypothetical protein
VKAVGRRIEDSTLDQSSRLRCQGTGPEDDSSDGRRIAVSETGSGSGSSGCPPDSIGRTLDQTDRLGLIKERVDLVDWASYVSPDDLNRHIPRDRSEA